jgi:predicted amidohydrolase
MKVAAYQAPLTPVGSMAALELVRRQVQSCESEGIEVLCCPEAVLGGLADYATAVKGIALRVDNGELQARLAPLASEFVTAIVGFTEVTLGGRLHNSAAVICRGSVLGIYRKHYPAIRRSVYSPGKDLPVFQVGRFDFGIMICNDSNHVELAADLAARGATAVFVPTNNLLPPAKADVVNDTRMVDSTIARTHGLHVIRADVAGQNDSMVSYGSSAITRRDGVVLQSARRLSEDLLVAYIA